MSDQIEPPAASAGPAVKRPNAGHSYRLRRLPVAPGYLGNGRLVDRMVHYLAPWDTVTYPGRTRLVLALLPKMVTRRAVQHWRQGTRALPAWAADAFADAIEARARAGLDLVAELRAAAAADRSRPREVTGLMAWLAVHGYRRDKSALSVK